jgi:hypothetical protein
MMRGWNERKPLAGAAVFVLAFLYLYWISGDVLRTAGDEGIYLEGGRRVALGQQPYRDFFAFTGPLTFWLEGALARASGMRLAIMRLPAILDAAFLSWAVYWLTSRYAGAFYSAGAAVAYLAYISRPHLLNVNHRWDSAALVTAAIAAAWAARRTNRRELWLAAGFLAVAAAWATPPVLLVALPLLVWSGGGALTFVAGAALAAGVGAAYLQWSHALAPMIAAMRWAGAHYTAANIVPYGSVWLGTLPGAETAGLNHLAATISLAIPAILPPIALAAWIWHRWRGKDRKESAETLPLVAATVALVFSAWPRWTADALLHTMALSWFLCALLLYRVCAPRQRLLLGGAIVIVAAVSLAGKSMEPLDYLPRETRVGTVRSPIAESEFLAGLEHWVQPGDSLFSFAYMPSFYYFLNASTPCRYSFLQPGMMTADDERRALADLIAAPPEWVISEEYPAQMVLAIWPGSDPALIPMETIHSYLREHYRPVDQVNGEWAHVVVMKLQR